MSTPVVADLVAEARLDIPEFHIGDPEATYRRLRAEAPVYWYEPGKFYAVSRYQDVRFVLSNPGLFSSEHGNAMGDNLYPERLAIRVPPGAENILGTDPPRHAELRKLVSKAFTPRMVNQLEPGIRAVATRLIERVAPGEDIDFVDVLAAPFPIEVIAQMLGVPPEDYEQFRHWSDAMFDTTTVTPSSPNFATVSALLMQMWGYFTEKLNDRRQSPRDDLLTGLLQAELDGEKLVEATAVFFCISLLAAGNETTRGLLAGGALAFAENPTQWHRLRADAALLPNAIEEMLRWVSPFPFAARTATEDVTLHGQAIGKGDYLVLLLASANHDEEIWPYADHFDIGRSVDPNQLSFGWGPHVCLGGGLARLETRIFWEELGKRFSGLHLSGQPHRRPSGLYGIERLPMSLS
jgi:cytochrome P450